MRKVLNKILKKHGYRIEKVSRFTFILEDAIKAKRNFKFVQVGANDGVRFDSLYFFVTQNRCPGLVIEPLPDMFERLRMNYADYPEIIPVNVAVHPTQSSATIYRVDPKKVGNLPDFVAGIASFLPDHHLKSNVPKEAILQETVQCAPLMSVLKKYNALDADLLQIDTEGFDAEVIKMIDFSILKPQLIKYEHQNLNATDRQSTRSLLERQGYKIVEEGADTIAIQST
jgi:FkbM family methyltransferase